MTSRDSSPGVAVGVALLMILSVALSTVGFAGAAAAQSSQADVVFVWDISGSMDDEADDLISETKTLASELESSGVDAQYGVVFMDNPGDPDFGVRQDLTSDRTKINDALDSVSEESGDENASAGILAALNDISYREGSQKVIVVFTDCQDLAGADARDTAISELNEANAYLVSVSPDEDKYNCPHTSSDSTGVGKEDELKYLAEERADNGTWSDIESDFKNVVKDIIGTVQRATGGSSDDDGDPVLSDVDVRAESSGGDGGAGASAEGGEITTTFESDENPVDVEVLVEGPDGETTLTRGDFSGDRFDGYESTFEPDEPGEYTLTIQQARTASNEDLLEETGEITRSVTIEGDNETDAANGTEAGNETDATDETDAANETETEPEPVRERPGCTTAEVADEVTVDGEVVSTVPPAEPGDAEWVETTTAEVDGEERRVRLVDTTGDGEGDLAVVDRDGDGDVDPTCGQFRTINPNLDWDSLLPVVT